MQKLLLSFTLILVLFLLNTNPTLKGTWEYGGGKFNNKISAAPKGYTQQRKYSDTSFDAFLYEKGEKTMKYESGNYVLSADSCLETQTYCLQTQKMIGITIPYHYAIRNDTLILSGKLPNGAVIEDYWKKVK